MTPKKAQLLLARGRQAKRGQKKSSLIEEKQKLDVE